MKIKLLCLLLTVFMLVRCGTVDCNKSADYFRKLDMNFVLIKKNGWRFQVINAT